jgi:hypothetical protein
MKIITDNFEQSRTKTERTPEEFEAATKLIGAFQQFIRSIREMDLELACRGLSVREKERLFQVTFPEFEKTTMKIWAEMLKRGVDSKAVNQEIAAMLGSDDLNP